MLRLRHFIEKLQGALPVLASRRSNFDKQMEAITKVPNDVKVGHFAVVAVKGDETKRFIIQLSYLADPAFLRLLELAKDEYGFRQKGALVVPCQPVELQKILDARKEKTMADNGSV